MCRDVAQPAGYSSWQRHGAMAVQHLQYSIGHDWARVWFVPTCHLGGSPGLGLCYAGGSPDCTHMTSIVSTSLGSSEHTRTSVTFRSYALLTASYALWAAITVTACCNSLYATHIGMLSDLANLLCTSVHPRLLQDAAPVPSHFLSLSWM